MLSISISRARYDELIIKEFVFEINKTKYAEMVSEGRYVDNDTKIMYGLTTTIEESLKNLRERLAKEQEAQEW